MKGSLTIIDIIRYHIGYYVRALDYYENRAILKYKNGSADVKSEKNTYNVIISTSVDKTRLLTHNCTCPTKHRICKHIIATYIYAIKDGYKPLTTYEESIKYTFKEIDDMTLALESNKIIIMSNVLNSLSDKIDWTLISDKRFEKHGLLITTLESRLTNDLKNKLLL